MSIINGKNNKLLQGAEQAVAAKLLAQTRADYEKIVVAGMKASLNGGPDSMLAKLADSQDVVKDCAAGAISLVMLLASHAKGVPPIQAMVPAAATLMFQALDFAEKAKLVTVDMASIDRGQKIQANAWLHLGNITPDTLTKMAEKTHGIMTDPTQMEMVAREGGVVKDPRTSTPTLIGGRNVAA